MECGVTPHFSTAQVLLENIVRKDKFWPKAIEKHRGKVNIDKVK